MLSDLFIREIKRKPASQTPAPQPGESGQLAWDESSYVFSLPVVRHLTGLKLTKPVTFFVGENGTGKSTLLEAMAVNYGLNPEGGSRNFNFSTKATHSPLHRHLTLVKGPFQPKDAFFLRAESFYNVSTEVDRLYEGEEHLLGGWGGASLHDQSHGESFLSLVTHRFRGRGLYLLDEPEAALSPTGQFSLLALMARLAKEGSQLIVATHSPILMALPGASIYVLGEDGISLTPYEQTGHYILTKQFLNNPRGILAQLLD